MKELIEGFIVAWASQAQYLPWCTWGRPSVLVAIGQVLHEASRHE